MITPKKTRHYSMTIKLPPVTKKNSQRICRTPDGKLFIASSLAYKQYERDASYFLKPLGIDYAVNILCLFYMQTKRKVDLTNLLEAVDDVLVKCGTIVDDNSTIVYSHDGSRVLYDPENPRTEIYISEVVKEVQPNE